MMNDVILKIQKLLALSESSNENEAKNAMLKAQQLLVKNKLTMQEVKSTKATKIEISTEKTDVTFTKAKWKPLLANIIAENFCCYNYITCSRTNRIVFMGKKEDVYICNLVFKYALDTIDTNVKALQYAYYKKKKSAKGLQSDYAIGFTLGLKKSFDAQKKQNSEWGLVLTKDKAVEEAFETLNFTETISFSNKYNGHSKAYNAGKKDGERFSISDKIENEGEPITLITS